MHNATLGRHKLFVRVDAWSRSVHGCQATQWTLAEAPASAPQTNVLRMKWMCSCCHCKFAQCLTSPVGSIVDAVHWSLLSFVPLCRCSSGSLPPWNKCSRTMDRVSRSFLIFLFENMVRNILQVTWKYFYEIKSNKFEELGMLLWIWKNINARNARMLIIVEAFLNFNTFSTNKLY